MSRFRVYAVVQSKQMLLVQQSPLPGRIPYGVIISLQQHSLSNAYLHSANKPFVEAAPASTA